MFLTLFLKKCCFRILNLRSFVFKRSKYNSSYTFLRQYLVLSFCNFLKVSVKTNVRVFVFFAKLAGFEPSELYSKTKKKSFLFWDVVFWNKSQGSVFFFLWPYYISHSLLLMKIRGFFQGCGKKKGKKVFLNKALFFSLRKKIILWPFFFFT